MPMPEQHLTKAQQRLRENLYPEVKELRELKESRAADVAAMKLAVEALELVRSVSCDLIDDGHRQGCWGRRIAKALAALRERITP